MGKTLLKNLHIDFAFKGGLKQLKSSWKPWTFSGPSGKADSTLVNGYNFYCAALSHQPPKTQLKVVQHHDVGARSPSSGQQFSPLTYQQDKRKSPNRFQALGRVGSAGIPLTHTHTHTHQGRLWLYFRTRVSEECTGSGSRSGSGTAVWGDDPQWHVRLLNK